MLYSNKIRADERDVVDLAERADDSAVVDAGDEDGEEVGEERGLFLEIECERLVVARDVVSIVEHAEWGTAYISMLATRTTVSLNWLCSQASAERSIIARAALSWQTP